MRTTKDIHSACFGASPTPSIKRLRFGSSRNASPRPEEFRLRIESDEDREYVGLCAELPSLSWLAKTPDAALKGIRKLVSKIVADMIQNKEPIPDPIATKH